MPVYCGEETLGPLVDRIASTMERLRPFDSFEIILVDDCSPDGSYDVIKRLAEALPYVIGVRLKENIGQQNATYCGMHEARGRMIVTLDDDLQHEPELVPALLERLESGADLVYGVFTQRADGAHRKWGSKLTACFFASMFKQLKDHRVSSFRAFSRELCEQVKGQETGFVYVSCLLLSKNPVVDNVLIPFVPRAHGRSNYSLKKLLKLFLKLYVHYGPLRGAISQLFTSGKPCFQISEKVHHHRQGVIGYENYDARRRHQSAVCHS